MLNGWMDGSQLITSEQARPGRGSRAGLGWAGRLMLVEQGPVRYPNYGRVQDTAKPSMMHDIIAGSRSEMYG